MTGRKARPKVRRGYFRSTGIFANPPHLEIAQVPDRQNGSANRWHGRAIARPGFIRQALGSTLPAIYEGKMNRRTFLASLAATSLTPIMPNLVFASGGIVNPEPCGFVGEMASNSRRYIGIDPISMMVHLFEHGDGTDRKSGLVTVTTSTTWAEKTPTEILADINAFLVAARPRAYRADSMILTEDRYTRFLRA